MVCEEGTEGHCWCVGRALKGTGGEGTGRALVVG